MRALAFVFLAFPVLAFATGGSTGAPPSPALSSDRHQWFPGNRLNLVAPQNVLEAVQRFQEVSKISDTQGTLNERDAAMSAVFYAMRKVLGITPVDVEAMFRVRLWASGQKPTSGHK